VFGGNEGVWLPAIQAKLALDRKNPASALNALQAVSPIMRRESNENWVPTRLTWVHLWVQLSGPCS
jgi:hypothetical protein